jgi:hypothetical protein
MPDKDYTVGDIVLLSDTLKRHIIERETTFPYIKDVGGEYVIVGVPKSPYWGDEFIVNIISNDCGKYSLLHLNRRYFINTGKKSCKLRAQKFEYHMHKLAKSLGYHCGCSKCSPYD